MEVSGCLHTLAALPLGKNPFYSLNKRQTAPQSQPECFGEEKNFLPLTGIEKQTVQTADGSLYNITIAYMFLNTLNTFILYCKLT